MAKSSENRTQSLNQEQIKSFQDKGYLVIDRIIDSSDFDLLISVISDVVDQQAKHFYEEGRISNLCRESEFDTRWYEILKQFGGQNEVYGWHTTVCGKPLFDLITHDAVLDVVGSLTNDEIQFNGDFWVRPKLPSEKLTTLPWHQDSAYMPNTEHHTHLSVWMPLVDVDHENGTLQFLPGSHKRGLRPHHRIEGEAFKSPTRDPIVGDAEVETLEMKVGDLVIFNNLVFHRSLMNQTQSIRWSVDFLFSQRDTPLTGLWHQHIACIVRSRHSPKTVASWSDWQALWESSPHKANFLW
ncbi:TPA: hypothetical protein EYM26_16065 [Candidatus Poribacteria bacterium]|nr:hypothetical protein [Candidatus Poribacteria bacterium]